jgi:hypothetical protein
MIRYKVVRRFGNIGYSCSADGEMGRVYSKEEFTVAPFGGLLVFEDLEKAKRWLGGTVHWARMGDQYEIWKVEAEEPVTLSKARLASPNWYCDVELVWNNRPHLIRGSGNSMHNPVVFGWPNGTEAFKKVKLLEEMT